MDGANLDQNGTETANDNERVLNTLYISRTGASPPDVVPFHTQDNFLVGFLTLCIQSENSQPHRQGAFNTQVFRHLVSDLATLSKYLFWPNANLS